MTYTSGTNDENGNQVAEKNILPVMSGSHPYNPGVKGIGMGYRVRFRLKTVGNFSGEDGAVKIEPVFYWTKDGRTFTEADLYYSEKTQTGEKYFVKVGSRTDETNLKYVTLGGDGAYNITTEKERNLGRYVAFLNSGRAEEIYTKTPLYSYGRFRLNQRVRIYGGCETDDDFDVDKYKALQIWYGEYSLPAEVYVLPKGMQKENGEILNFKINGREEEFLKDGFVVVKFKITAVRDALSPLLYANEENAGRGYCNMWSLENYKLIRNDISGNIWQFEYGDVLLFDRQSGINEDYLSRGTH